MFFSRNHFGFLQKSMVATIYYTISKRCYHIIGFRKMCNTAQQTNSLFYVKRDLLTEMVLHLLFVE